MKLSKLLLILPLVFFLIVLGHLACLSQNHEGDSILTAQTPDLTIEEDNTDEAFLICMAPESEMPTTLGFEYTSLADDDSPEYVPYFQLSPARPFELPASVAESNGLPAEVNCANTETYNLQRGTLSLEIPDQAIVIEAHSPTPQPYQNTTLQVALLLLMVGIGARCTQPIRIPQMSYPTGIAAFILSLLLAVGLSVGIRPFVPPNDGILPAFGSLMAGFGANFIAFMIVTAVCFKLAQRKEKSQDPPAPHISLLFTAILSGIGLAILAALTVAFAPLPRITTSELSTLLTSTRFATSYFAIMAGICEECLFRGVIQTSFMPAPDASHKMFKNALAVFITTVLFVGLHVPQSIGHLWALAPIAVVSITSGILRIKSETIYPSILLHITYNGCLLLPSTLMTSIPL